jgi:hypothetical protein
MANKYMKKCSKYVAIKKMLIKKKKTDFPGAGGSSL